MYIEDCTYFTTVCPLNISQCENLTQKCAVYFCRETIVCQKETIFLKRSLALAVRVFESAGLYPSQAAFTDSWDSIRVTACNIRIQM